MDLSSKIADSTSKTGADGIVILPAQIAILPANIWIWVTTSGFKRHPCVEGSPYFGGFHLHVVFSCHLSTLFPALRSPFHATLHSECWYGDFFKSPAPDTCDLYDFTMHIFPCIHTNTKKTHRKDLRTFYIRSCASTHHQKHISYIYHISMSKKKHKNIHPSLWAMLGQSRTWKFLTNFISEIRQGCHGDVHGLHLLRLSLQLLCGDGHPSLHSGLGETSWGSSKLYLIDWTMGFIVDLW